MCTMAQSTSEHQGSAELRRTPYTRSSQNASSTTFVNKGKKRKGWGLTLPPFADGSRITLGPRNLVVKLAKAKLIQ
jgi:hypothetical protein